MEKPVYFEEIHHPSDFHNVEVYTSSIYLPVKGYIKDLEIGPHITDGNPKPGCKCGMKREMENRIVGGDTTEVNEYPWMVLIYKTETNQLHVDFSCGGSLIADSRRRQGNTRG
eukprot:TRINITY_DN20243_c0_g1_i1.p1 TRINITY_DN20243_c0_g1~~TRINITY_DN20243_c0_g1_i1.p1  ORF type:complete len:113 (+),score=14.99 TRINITY_DN20243_c0_g1_i1:270-608(+)